MRQTKKQNSTAADAFSNSDLRLLPGETEAEYNQLKKHWEANYEDMLPEVASLLESAISADRLLRRAKASIFDAECAVFAAQQSGNAEEIARAYADRDRATKWKASQEQSFGRALRNLEQVAGRRTRQALALRKIEGEEMKVTLDLQIRAYMAAIPPEILTAWIDAAMNFRPKPQRPQTSPENKTDETIRS